MYVLLFPRGELGWHPRIPLSGVDGDNEENDPENHINDFDGHDNQNAGQATQRKQTNVSQLQYYAFRLFPRKPEQESQHLFQAGRLFQQFIVDSWAQIDQSRLRWLKLNQDKLRVELYSGLVDAVHGGDHQNNPPNLQDIGQPFILPSSYIGGSRHMFQLCQDSLAIARYFGKPGFFLTITTNPNWSEIKNELLPGQSPSDRPDLIARVFHEKVKEIMKLITKSGILGKVVGYVWTIEFQKRGLPHIHILIFLAPESHLHDPAMINSAISAQIPNPATHPRLYHLVTSHMIHGPCGIHNPNAPCMENGKCTKRYPRTLQDTTTLTNNGYPTYAWPHNGHTWTIPSGQLRSLVVDNS